jgi:hypothetical protein
VIARRRPSQAGQSMVLVGLMMIILLTGVGVAIDASQGYYYNATAERAASAAALSGVIYMPNQFSGVQAIPAGSGNDATDRADTVAVQNGHGVVVGTQPCSQAVAPCVQVLQVTGQPNQLQVTVYMVVTTLFMRTFGVNSFPVSRTAIAEYLTPISLGQPGSQTGSTVSQLGSPGSFYFMREEGWSADRGEGDAYTPNPAIEYGATLSPAAQDQHQIGGSNDVTDPDLPTRGGYNYLVTLPAGGYIQVYNAAFSPDGNGGSHNYCENSRLGSKNSPIGPCSSGGSYYYHEEDGVTFTDPTTFATMEYTLFQVNNSFVHSTDTELAQMKVFPIDASNWNASKNQYTNANTGAKITQSYTGTGAPINLLVYHNWVDVTTYAGSSDGGLVQRLLTFGTTQLPAGTYRLRVDMLDSDGTLPPGNQRAHKGYAVRALDTSGSLCSACSVGAWADMAIYTPIATSGGGSFTIPIFELPPSYAGRTISVDVFDPGDISGAGNVDINILDPSGFVVAATAPATVSVYDLGVDRAALAGKTLIGTPVTATFRAASNGATLYDGHWVELQIPIPQTYSPGTNPANWVFSLQYATSNGVTATDTVTVAVGLAGAPAHLVSS